MNSSSRRKFLKSGGLGLTGVLSSSILAHGSVRINAESPKEMTVLFQGDSITDAGRDKSRYYANDTAGMGSGYVFQIVAHLLGNNPDKEWKYYNRGISGNKVFQLANRWEDDCLQLKPDVLSILIGVNDFWHSLNNYNGTAEIYEEDLRKLLDRTLKEMPDLKLILGEPFAVKGGSAIDDRWYPDFPLYQDAAARIAKDYNAQYVRYQKVFDDALKIAPASYWCPDGVHPSMAGAYLMKESWLKAFEQLFS